VEIQVDQQVEPMFLLHQLYCFSERQQQQCLRVVGQLRKKQHNHLPMIANWRRDLFPPFFYVRL